GRIADRGRNHTSIRGNSYARRIGVRGEVAARIWGAPQQSVACSPRSTITLRCRRAAGFLVADEKDSRRKLDLRADSEGFARPARRDHWADRSQNGDQRAQLRRENVHGG